MKVFIRISNIVDTINETVGQIVKYAIVPLILISLFEVMIRYLFNSPTVWAWELNTFLLCIMSLMGAGYTHLHGGHIRVEMFVNRAPPKTGMAIELIVNFIFLLSLVVLMREVGKMAFSSLSQLERSASFWSPPVWPLKMQILIGVFLLFLQCLTQFFNQICKYIELLNTEAGEKHER